MKMLLEKIKNTHKHAGAGRNVNPFTLVKNVLPAYVLNRGYAFTPLTVFLSVNSVCNLHCKMCDIGQKNKESSFYANLKPAGGGEELDFKRVSGLIKEVSAYRPKPRISITTTEPFLYKRIFDIARLASGHGMEFQVTTNGALLEQYIPEIFSSRLTELAVSIDGKGSLHDEIRGESGLYREIIASLKVIRDQKIKNKSRYPLVTIATTVSNFNFNRLYDFLSDLEEDYYDRLIISHMNFIDRQMAEEHNKKFIFVGKAVTAGLPGETDNSKVDVDELHAQLVAIKNKYTKVVFAPDFDLAGLKTFYERPEQFVWKSRCYVPWFVVEILANGDVVPLTRCIHIVMGNIYEDSLSKIWNSQRYREFRRQLQEYKRFPICRRCRGIL